MNTTVDIKYLQQQEARPDMGSQMLPLPNLEDICLWVSGHRGHLNTRIDLCLPGACWSPSYQACSPEPTGKQCSSRFQADCLQQTDPLKGSGSPLVKCFLPHPSLLNSSKTPPPKENKKLQSYLCLLSQHNVNVLVKAHTSVTCLPRYEGLKPIPIV